MAIVCPELVLNSDEELSFGSPSSLPLGKPVPVSAIGTRRHAFSSESGDPRGRPGSGLPRMTRRCAISYEPTDVTARYIRFLGDAVSKRNHLEKQEMYLALLPELLPSNSNLMVPKRNGRRGSLRPVTAASSYKEVMKDSILHAVNIDMQGKLEEMVGVETWSFDMFAFRRVTEGRPLFHLGFHLLHKHGLVVKFNLDNFKLIKFLACVEEAYRPDNCYHNSTHAADVTQALNCLLLEPKISAHLTDQELLAALIAAMCHDLDHPGVNQAYLLNTSSHLAHIHGTHSVLERHHCQQARSILCQSGLFDNLPCDEKKVIISLMETMILATDVSQHGDFLAHFKDMIVDDAIDLADDEDRHFMLTIAIKVADISNPSRPLNLSKCWSRHIMEEFFRQGDSERKLNIPVSTFCDRYAITIPKSQSGFFEFLALPLFKAWSEFFNSGFSNILCDNVITNKAYWDGLVSAMEKDEHRDEDVVGKGGSAALADESNSDKEDTIHEASATDFAQEEMTLEVSAEMDHNSQEQVFGITSQVTKEDVPGEE